MPDPTNSTKVDFVSLLCETTKKLESPLSFWKWSAYAAVAATLRYNCYIKWGNGNLYPNIYVLLLADSASFRKDAGPELIEEILRECSHTKVISGRASWQGIVDELSMDIGIKGHAAPIRGGAGIIIGKEFTSTFVNDDQLIQMMTEGYAYAKEYEYTLRGGKTKIKDRCITLLGGSNETLLRDFYNIRANYGGLLRRTLLIKPDKKRPANALMEDDDNLTELDKKTLINSLREIQILKGEFIKTKEAKETWKEWYIELYANYEKFEDKAGFVQGAHALIWKLAMIIAAANYKMEITEKIISKAIKEVIALKENYVSYVLGTGRNPHADISAMIMSTMWDACNNGHGGKLKKRDILLKYWNHVSSEDLDKIITTLENAGLVRMMPQGSEPAYELTEKAKDIWLRNIK